MIEQDESEMNVAMGIYRKNGWQPEEIDYHGYLEINFEVWDWNIDLVEPEFTTQNYTKLETHFCSV